jgi:GT2 family glycosyltransferase
MFTLMHGRNETSFAGKVIGPAINLLPEDRANLPEVVPVEWLNTTCTIYRREALPTPVFESIFVGYSLLEDLALSLRVAQSGWKLANARTARVFHDSQPGTHKDDLACNLAMDVCNRHYVLKNVLDAAHPINYFKWIIWEVFQFAAQLTNYRRWRFLIAYLRGKFAGLHCIYHGTEQ